MDVWGASGIFVSSCGDRRHYYSTKLQMTLRVCACLPGCLLSEQVLHACVQAATLGECVVWGLLSGIHSFLPSVISPCPKPKLPSIQLRALSLCIGLLCRVLCFNVNVLFIFQILSGSSLCMLALATCLMRSGGKLVRVATLGNLFTTPTCTCSFVSFLWRLWALYNLSKSFINVLYSCFISEEEKYLIFFFTL